VEEKKTKEEEKKEEDKKPKESKHDKESKEEFALPKIVQGTTFAMHGHFKHDFWHILS